MFVVLSCILLLFILGLAISIYVAVVYLSRKYNMNLNDTRGIYLIAHIFLMFLGCVFCFYGLPYCMSFFETDNPVSLVSQTATINALLVHLAIVLTMMAWGMAALAKHKNNSFL